MERLPHHPEKTGKDDYVILQHGKSWTTIPSYLPVPILFLLVPGVLSRTFKDEEAGGDRNTSERGRTALWETESWRWGGGFCVGKL